MIKQKVSLLVVVCLTFELAACVWTHEPRNNDPFDLIESIKQLEGVYRNLGETESKTALPPVYLSSFIWQGAKGIKHDSITTIEVRAIGDDTLLVSAYGKTGVEKTERYKRGKDFDFTSGRILLKLRVDIGNSIGIGPSYQTLELGLDKRGHGKYKYQEAFAGLAFVIIPFAYSETREVRFVRVSK